VLQALLFQFRRTGLVLVLLPRHLQFRLALDAHAELFLAQGIAVRNALQLITVLQHLLAQEQSLLLHLDFLLTVGHELLVQGILLHLHLVQQLGIGQHQQRVALPHPCALLGHDALHVAAYPAVHAQGEHGLHHPLLLHVFQKVGLHGFGQSQRIGRHALFLGREQQGHRIGCQGEEHDASQHIIFVAHEPRFFLELYVHI